MCPLAMSGNIFKHSGTLCKSTLENFWQTSGMSTFEQTPTALFNKVLTQILYNGRESLVLCSMITSSEVVARSSKIQSFSRIQGCFLSKLFFFATWSIFVHRVGGRTIYQVTCKRQHRTPLSKKFKAWKESNNGWTKMNGLHSFALNGTLAWPGIFTCLVSQKNLVPLDVTSQPLSRGATTALVEPEARQRGKYDSQWLTQKFAVCLMRRFRMSRNLAKGFWVHSYSDLSVQCEHLPKGVGRGLKAGKFEIVFLFRIEYPDMSNGATFSLLFNPSYVKNWILSWCMKMNTGYCTAG